jgi:DNA mismatch repair ATPase MutS
MIKELILQIRHTYYQISFNRKKDKNERLKESFGRMKDDSFDFSMIEKYFQNKDHSHAYQVLSDKTCKDLDFDDLYMFMDRTNSRVGQQYLYNKLRTIKLNEQQTSLDEEIIDILSKDSKLRYSIQGKIEKLNNEDAYYIPSLFQEEHIDPPKWFFLARILSFTSALSIILSFIEPIFFIVLIVVFCINVVIHYWNKKNLVQYVCSIPQLFKLNNIASQLFTLAQLKKINPELLSSIKMINGVKNRMSFFKLEAKLQGDLEMIAWFIFEIFKILFLLEPLLLFGVLKRLKTKREEIEDVFTFVGRTDMLISIASLRAGLDYYCKPQIKSDNSKIITKDIYHPLILNCKSNSIALTDKSVLLTGSNMSGKTSFIRAIGLNVITGLTINTCFAKAMSFPLVQIYSAIRISDDLLNDKSYYFEEVLTIKEMITESKKGKRNLFLLDEIFKGTNTIERISAGKAVLSSLAQNNNTVLVSTHDIELTDMLSKEYELYHFSEILNKKSIGFDYQLKEGKLKNRNAIRILEINDYPKEIVSEAMAISRELDESYLATKI